MVNKLNECFKDNYCLYLPDQTIKITDYTNRIFKGEFAPTDFANFLRQGWQKLISSKELLTDEPFLSMTETREKNIKEIIACLKTSHNGKPVLNIVGDRAPTGLTALGSHLYNTIIKRKIAPVLYIPIGHKAPQDSYAGKA